MSRKKPLVLLPSYSGVDWRLLETLKKTGLSFIQVRGCSDLPRARSRLLTDGMKTDADIFLLIDSDMTLTPEGAVMLVESEKLDENNAVSGCYLVGDGRLAAVPEVMTEIEIGGQPRYQRLLFAGAGAAAVHRGTVDRLQAELPPVCDANSDEWYPYFVPFILEQEAPDGSSGHVYISEDYSFWYRLKTIARAQLWLDTHLTVGHVKERVLLPEGRVLPLGDFIGSGTGPQVVGRA